MGYLRLAAFVLFLAVALYGGWLLLIVGSGGQLFECDKGDCGTLSEFDSRLGIVSPLAALFVAVIAGILVRRKFVTR